MRNSLTCSLIVLCLLALSSLTTIAEGPAKKKKETYTIAQIKDPDGWANARTGPSLKFDVKYKLNNGRLVFVSDWPTPETLKQLRQSNPGEALRRLGIDLEHLTEWKWVILPGDNGGAESGGQWAYIHSSRLESVRKDALTWGRTLDPDGFQNVRESPNGAILGQVKSSGGFFLLNGDYPGGNPRRPTPGGWVRVLTSDGLLGYLKNDHLAFFDPREWQWAGDIPYVELNLNR